MVTAPARIVAIIPARGASKSIPRKNIKLLGGFPLLAYSIAAGLQSRCVARVLVSTENAEIARIARLFGAETPFLRPPELAQDDTPDFPVIEHALQWLEKFEGYGADVIVHLRPTSPLRPRHCIDEAVALLLQQPEADSVRSVKRAGENPYKMWRVEGGFLKPLLQTEFYEPYNMPRQKLPTTYWQTGQIDVVRRETIVHKRSLCGERILPFFVAPEYAVDIDDPQQWAAAEYRLRQCGRDLVLPQPRSVSACGSQQQTSMDCAPRAE